MKIYLITKILHIISAVFFIGVVSFRTLIIPVLRDSFELKQYKRINMLTGRRARDIIKINNIFLILTGVYLSLNFISIDMSVIMFLKILIGAILASIFYIVPIIMSKMQGIAWFSMFFHYLIFSLMMLTIVLSQLIFV